MTIIAGCHKSSAPTPTPVTDNFAKGADVSWLTEMEAAGKHFYNANGAQQDCLDILAGKNVNSIRLRVWVNPASGWCNIADVTTKAIRAKQKGMRIMIDFHYSDSWVDPGQQNKPAAWATYDLSTLKTAVYDHTRSVLLTLASNGITPEWVQIGNEVNDGFLWPDGKASVNMATFADLVRQGYAAAKSVSPSIKVIVHLSNGFDNSLFRWLFDGLISNGAEWDMIGMSLYPNPASWSTTVTQAISNMTDVIARYGKPVMVCETGMSWDQPTACKSFLSELIRRMKNIPGGMATGVFYWEPEAYNWQGYTLGAFDLSGKPTEALDAFR